MLQIEDGERCTLALWFTLDSSFDEDTKLLNSITESRPLLPDVGPHPSMVIFLADFTFEDIIVIKIFQLELVQKLISIECIYPPDDVVGIPVAASSSMYLVTLGHQETDRFTDITLDIRVARVIEAGFEIFVTFKNTFVSLKDIGNQLTSECFRDLQDALDKPVKIKLDGNDILYVCKNAIHALQVRGIKFITMHPGFNLCGHRYAKNEKPYFYTLVIQFMCKFHTCLVL
jgi:hypothetical protein